MLRDYSSQECDICRGRSICHVCGNKVVSRPRAFDFLDIYEFGGKFALVTHTLTSDVEAISMNISPPGSLQKVSELLKLAHCERKLTEKAFVRGSKTYADLFPRAKLVVATNDIFDPDQPSRLKKYVAYLEDLHAKNCVNTRRDHASAAMETKEKNTPASG